jgi:hypothetical protein
MSGQDIMEVLDSGRVGQFKNRELLHKPVRRFLPHKGFFRIGD